MHVVEASLMPTASSTLTMSIRLHETSLMACISAPAAMELLSIGWTMAVAFIELGRRIDVLAKGDDASITTALRLGAEKYGGAFELTGSEEFKRRAIDLMVEHRMGVRLRDTEQEPLRRAKTAAAAKQLFRQTTRRPSKP
ncbi:hypothetical protein WT12_28860 [Burkholderia territorii]|uniref:LPD7 domain-containing protein n=1 Tax=Burkholderia territorii TaxID=1503055 RepID=UPI00075BB6DC|nr:LPD7 domain-containing protein [Burkholderia territorii]KVN41134.1 hypothetical protein WT12_28860 [Burkholderia territorii]